MELGPLLFALFGVVRVLPLSVEETLFSWHGSFVRRKQKNVWRAAPLYLFWTLRKEKPKSIWKYKTTSSVFKESFVLNLLLWVRMYIAELSLFEFVDWAGSNQGRAVFCIFPHFGYAICFPLYATHVSWCIAFLINLSFLFLIKKKKLMAEMTLDRENGKQGCI